MEEGSAQEVKASSFHPSDESPRIYRVMKPDGLKPMIGTSSTCLGVRFHGESDSHDITPDPKGQVHPGTGGMSVSPSLRTCPFRRVPRRLRHLYPGAAGNDKHSVWSMGSGEFVAGPIAEGLRLRPDPESDTHGFVEPDSIMTQESYRNAIHATQDRWVIDES